jgi:CheY-like chemotaxis protein
LIQKTINGLGRSRGRAAIAAILWSIALFKSWKKSDIRLISRASYRPEEEITLDPEERPRDPSIPDAPGPAKTVLIVDDDTGFRSLVANLLASAGYRSTEATNGSEAIKATRANRIDLIIMDLVMPDGEGMEAIRYFSKQSPSIPVVAVSGKSSYLPSAKALGAAATLVKANVVEELLPAIQQALHA